jgi:hypothetical protein
MAVKLPKCPGIFPDKRFAVSELHKRLVRKEVLSSLLHRNKINQEEG